MAVYPAALPQPDLSATSTQNEDLTIRTEFDSGEIRVRRKAEVGYDQYTIRILVVGGIDQLKIFEAWFAYELNYGVDFFTLPFNGVDREFRWVGAYNIDYSQVVIPIVTGVIETRDRGLIDLDEYNASVDADETLIVYNDLLDETTAVANELDTQVNRLSTLNI